MTWENPIIILILNASRWKFHFIFRFLSVLLFLRLFPPRRNSKDLEVSTITHRMTLKNFSSQLILEEKLFKVMKDKKHEEGFSFLIQQFFCQILENRFHIVLGNEFFTGKVRGRHGVCLLFLLCKYICFWILISKKT